MLFGLTAVEINIISCENLISLLQDRKNQGAMSATSEQKGLNQGNMTIKTETIRISLILYHQPINYKDVFQRNTEMDHQLFSSFTDLLYSLI